MGFDYHVTGDHEIEAEAAERARRPTRLGLAILRMLGFKGPVPRPEPHRAASPRHEARPPSHSPDD